MIASDDISQDLKAVHDETVVLAKLLHRNKNQHGKSSLHGQLRGLHRLLKQVTEQSQLIVYVNSEVENCVRSLRRTKVSNTSKTLGSNCLIATTQIIVLLTECIRLAQMAARNASAQVALMLFLPLFTVYVATASRVSMLCSRLAAYHYNTLKVLQTSLQACAACHPKYQASIHALLARYALEKSVMEMVDDPVINTNNRPSDIISRTPLPLTSIGHTTTRQSLCEVGVIPAGVPVREGCNTTVAPDNDMEDIGEAIGDYGNGRGSGDSSSRRQSDDARTEGVADMVSRVAAMETKVDALVCDGVADYGDAGGVSAGVPRLISDDYNGGKNQRLQSSEPPPLPVAVEVAADSVTSVKRKKRRLSGGSSGTSDYSGSRDSSMNRRGDKDTLPNPRISLLTKGEWKQSIAGSVTIEDQVCSPPRDEASVEGRSGSIVTEGTKKKKKKSTTRRVETRNDIDDIFGDMF